MRRWLLLSAALAVVAFARPASADVPECPTLEMTVTAELSTDPGFEGLYKYTVTGCWDVSGAALSHIDFFLQLKDLECICDPRVIKFPTPGGTSDGYGPEGACKVTYSGEYNCKGDPTVPSQLNAPTVKFNADEGDCEPGVSGCGSWVFYSPFAPGPYSEDPTGAAIKHGQDVCVGTLKGTMPVADCSTPANSTTWGNLKALYR